MGKFFAKSRQKAVKETSASRQKTMKQLRLGSRLQNVLSPLVVAFKVCQLCFARVYRGFWILDPCTTCVRPVYDLCTGWVTSLQGYNVTTGDGGRLRQRFRRRSRRASPTWARMFHVLRATCYKVDFPEEIEDFGGERRMFHVLHATN
jgi:hypothetical protein